MGPVPLEPSPYPAGQQLYDHAPRIVPIPHIFQTGIAESDDKPAIPTHAGPLASCMSEDLPDTPAYRPKPGTEIPGDHPIVNSQPSQPCSPADEPGKQPPPTATGAGGQRPPSSMSRHTRGVRGAAPPGKYCGQRRRWPTAT